MNNNCTTKNIREVALSKTHSNRTFEGYLLQEYLSLYDKWILEIFNENALSDPDDRVTEAVYKKIKSK